MKKTNKQRNAIQKHHLSYTDPEIVVKIYKKEHWIITQMNRFNPISQGFIKCLRYFIKKNKDKAIKL